jgi:hypothetical protein
LCRRSVQDVACEIILKHPKLSAQQIAELVRREIPDCDCGAASIGSYRSKLKSGEIVALRNDGGNAALTFKSTKNKVGGVAVKAKAASDALKKPRLDWPDFGRLADEEILELARLTTRHICFLHPDIVRKLVEDNERRRDEWRQRLAERGVNPDLYLWPGSSCVFPGVRRYAGSDEIASFRKQKEFDSRPGDALSLDDNSYPKQIWSFVFLGKKFGNFGPEGYALAHLIDHKEYKNRLLKECDSDHVSGAISPLFGLFTSPTNTIYIPTGLMRPTDFSFPLRNLIQRKSQALYGDFCNLLPEHLPFKDGGSDRWALDAFDWREPVGTLDHVRAFLDFRHQEMERLFALCPAKDGVPA